MRTMKVTRCLPCRLVVVVASHLRSRKRTVVTVLLASFIVVVLTQKYWVQAHLQYLLEYDFAVSPTRRAGNTVRTKVPSYAVTGETNLTENNSMVDFYEPSKCPRSIASLPKYSQWFRERFKPNVKLFLDKLDGDSIGNLSFYELPFGFKDENHRFINRLLHHGNFKNLPLNLRRDKECISCAVVGSGGILNGSYAGKEIDAHDLVFRLNTAITYGRYAKDVGSRTDFYMFFPESAHLNSFSGQNVTLLYTMYKSFDVEYVAELLNINRLRISRRMDPDRLKIIHPDFFRYVFAKFLDGRAMKPTTGAIVVMLAVHLCDSVTIYGFGYDPQFSMHYYDAEFLKRTYRSTWTHDVENEKRLWGKLHQEGALRFFKRDVM
ncbi:alpha-N-acetylgalactosaminide alpha-2,6-sialyltransferase 1-like [Acanthaster planci]|uniref:alpha-N-acetylgalactosaminide alpha-2,6-sialyltransferase n=1 Tax=Acanthaster planci TaxID=133434 RepID=A0A8B7XHA5_ACAPL|nr:alpha-N-acetylgalactosaminide alpha-2,6-sialyltransferase 1-like [Acanthaster planci]XP_022080179.1 alpha-N-acetylgalactosaminide alpha-2,6-sialyltransferase 1-like [Acanthaster planci]